MRIEQLYPFPHEEFAGADRAATRTRRASCGARRSRATRARGTASSTTCCEHLRADQALTAAQRKSSASPAVGYLRCTTSSRRNSSTRPSRWTPRPPRRPGPDSRRRHTEGNDMQVEVKVPQLSESVSEATLVAWHKKVGRARSSATRTSSTSRPTRSCSRLPAPADGVIAKIVKADGEHRDLGRGDRGDRHGRRGGGRRSRSRSRAGREGRGCAPAAPAGKAASPSAAKIAAEKGVDTAAIAGSGRDGRVTKGDVLTAPTGAAAPAPAPAPAPAATQSARPRRRPP